MCERISGGFALPCVPLPVSEEHQSYLDSLPPVVDEYGLDEKGYYVGIPEADPKTADRIKSVKDILDIAAAGTIDVPTFNQAYLNPDIRD